MRLRRARDWVPLRRGRWTLWLAGAALALLACGSSHELPKQVAPVLLAQLALSPADLGGAYAVLTEGYRDQNGNPSRAVTSQFVRQLQLSQSRELQSAHVAATHVLVSLSDLGEADASEFMDAAADGDVGPPDLSDYISEQVAGAHDIKVQLVDDFPRYDDDTVADRLSWEQDANGGVEFWQAYGAYVRSGGLLAFVVLRAPVASDGAEAEGLRKQMEAASKQQADKLKRLGQPPAASHN